MSAYHMDLLEKSKVVHWSGISRKLNITSKKKKKT